MPWRAVAEELSDVGPAIAWADARASEAGLNGDVRFAIQLCLEEALSNLILHARAEPGRKDIRVDFAASLTGATLTVSDACMPFDIETVPMPAPPSRNEMRPGGYGLRLIRGFATGLAYRSSGGRNHLILTFAPGAAQ
jgi:anti-sigma regulatory factor (Ser/Thr protein kinase)